MLEATVAVSIAITTGLGAVLTRQNQRMLDLDNRIDSIELRVAERYVQRQELATALEKIEDHMIRIENKLDKIALHGK
tara:strand:+ start:7952 stop:8185 length:234 start_codon:yes stop_codon:yes gene_type:complete